MFDVEKIYDAARERMRAASGQLLGILCTEDDWMTSEEKQIVHQWKLGLVKMTNDRRNITQPADWWAAFSAEAEKAGVSLSEWIGDACRDKLPKKVAKSLSARPPAHRPKKNPENSV